MGTFAGPTLTAATNRGGTTYVRASANGKSGFATLHVKLHATITDTCPGCPAFRPDNAPPCGAANRQPQALYPPTRPCCRPT